MGGTLGRKHKEIRICPVCGMTYSTVERKKKNGRVYLYAVHWVKTSDGKRTRVRHYLRPEKYVKHSKLMTVRAVLKQLDSVIDFLGYAKLSKEDVEAMLEKVEYIRGVLTLTKMVEEKGTSN